MRIRLGRRTTVTFGKPPYPDRGDQDPLSRLAYAYGVRRDSLDIVGAICERLELPADRSTTQAIVGMVAAMTFTFPETLDRLAAGEPAPQPCREHMVGLAELVNSAGPLVDAVLSDVASVLDHPAVERRHPSRSAAVVPLYRSGPGCGAVLYAVIALSLWYLAGLTSGVLRVVLLALVGVFAALVLMYFVGVALGRFRRRRT